MLGPWVRVYIYMAHGCVCIYDADRSPPGNEPCPCPQHPCVVCIDLLHPCCAFPVNGLPPSAVIPRLQQLSNVSTKMLNGSVKTPLPSLLTSSCRCISNRPPCRSHQHLRLRQTQPQTGVLHWSQGHMRSAQPTRPAGCVWGTGSGPGFCAGCCCQ